jgi:hypothetical protein
MPCTIVTLPHWSPTGHEALTIKDKPYFRHHSIDLIPIASQNIQKLKINEKIFIFLSFKSHLSKNYYSLLYNKLKNPIIIEYKNKNRKTIPLNRTTRKASYYRINKINK